MNEQNMGRTETSPELLTRDKNREDIPSMYKVLLFNDDYTTREFVVEILINYFHKNEADATLIMQAVHESGSGIAGVYPYDIGITKVAQVTKYARDNQFPLKLVLEEV